MERISNKGSNRVSNVLERVLERGWCIESLRFSLPNFARLSIGEADFASQPHSPNDDDIGVLGLGRRLERW